MGSHFSQSLSHAHPIDLHALRVVNRSFRTFLSSPASNDVWKRSFRNSGGADVIENRPGISTVTNRGLFSLPNSSSSLRASVTESLRRGTLAIPECPEDMNGWEWATLLFGAPRCDVRFAFAFWMLRRRVQKLITTTRTGLR